MGDVCPLGGLWTASQPLSFACAWDAGEPSFTPDATPAPLPGATPLGCPSCHCHLPGLPPTKESPVLGVGVFDLGLRLCRLSHWKSYLDTAMQTGRYVSGPQFTFL